MLQVRSKDLHNALKADRLAFYFPQQRKKKNCNRACHLLFCVVVQSKAIHEREEK